MAHEISTGRIRDDKGFTYLTAKCSCGKWEFTTGRGTLSAQSYARSDKVAEHLGGNTR